MLKKDQLIQIQNLQAQLDQKIAQVRSIDECDEKILVARFLALIVEIAEFANEKRCFKYWSQKLESEKTVLLEEYSDALHFIVSIANSLNIAVAEAEIIIKKYDDINLAFLALIDAIISFSKSKSFSDFNTVLNIYFSIGSLCGFSNNDIFIAYIAKNKINHLRQKQNY